MGKGLCPWQPMGGPWAPLNTLSPCSVFRRREGREGGVRRLGECGSGVGQGQWGLSLPLLYHASFCVPNSSQGPAGPPGSTGQKVTGLGLKGWVAERSEGSTDMRREVTSGTELAVPANTPSHSTMSKFPPRPGGKCHRPQRERPGWFGSSSCCLPSCADEAV